MSESRFVYATYIRTTPEKLWQALTEPEFTRRYWMETWQDCAWRVGAPWRLMIPDGRVADVGEVLELVPNRRLVLSWKHEFTPAARHEVPTRLTYEIEPRYGMVKLTVVHESETPASKTIEAVSNGWPLILSSLKSMLENDESLESTRRWPVAM